MAIKKKITSYHQSNMADDSVQVEDFNSNTLKDILHEIVVDGDQGWWGSIDIRNSPDYVGNKFNEYRNTIIDLRFITDTKDEHPEYPYTLEIDNYGEPCRPLTDELDNFLDCKVVALRCTGSWGFYTYYVYIQNENSPYTMKRVGNDYGDDIHGKYKYKEPIMISAREAKAKIC